MNLSRSTLNAMVLVLTGDNNISPYNSGLNLVEFFNSIGLAEIYYRGFPSRRNYANEKLVQINGSLKIEKAINEIVDKRRFINTNFKVEKAVEYLNEFLRIDGYEIIYIENNYKIKNLKNKNMLNNIENNKIRSVESIDISNIKISGDSMNKKIFVIHGRNERIRKAFFEFLRAIGLNPIEWNQAIKLTGKGSPYIGEILEEAFKKAKSIVVLFTPDEISTLKKELIQVAEDGVPFLQPRPNVIFEAGMAMGKNPDRTILVEIGKIREISDIVGRHVVKFDGSAKKRLEMIEKLKISGCDVDNSGEDWLDAGDFTDISLKKEKVENKIIKRQDNPKFKLIRAVYGTDEYSINVYDELCSMIDKSGLSMTASNDIAGDPHKKARKTLTITYESYGKVKTVEVPEHNSISLP